MSFIGKKWVVKNQNENLTLIDKLLQNRNLESAQEKADFFEGGLERLFDPMLLKDMDKAVKRIKEAVDKNEQIMIFGDYDVDGISATVLLYDFFKRIGANIHYRLPDREKDGYGLKDFFMRQFAEQKMNLVITVDCGTSNRKEIALAKELGMDVIVTDHHNIPAELPDAVAVINPRQEDCKYPNKELSGSAVAYKLVAALAPLYFDRITADQYLGRQLGIAVLGLVSDCMTLTGENRFMTKHGLESIRRGDHAGINALLKDAKIELRQVTSGTIGFVIGPRINAAGRLDVPEHALELLMGNVDKVARLSELNTERQKRVEEFVNEAKEQVAKYEVLPRVIVVKSVNWNAGTLGLVAGKICDLYNRPAIAMQDKETEYTASIRSCNDFDITGYLRSEALDLFSAFGGHRLAGGFTLPKANYEKLMQVIEKTSSSYINPAEFYGTVEIDAVIKPEELSFETIEQMQKLQPFGNGNPEPMLMVKGAKILELRPVGKKKEHIQFPIQYGDKKCNAIAFRFGEHLDKIDQEIKYDIAFNLEINEWNGYKNMQMRVVDIKKSE